MYIKRAPEHISIFKHKKPWWSNWIDLPDFLLKTALMGIFIWISGKFAYTAFYHPEYPHSLAAMVFAFGCFAYGTFNGAIAGKLALRMAGF